MLIRVEGEWVERTVKPFYTRAFAHEFLTHALKGAAWHNHRKGVDRTGRTLQGYVVENSETHWGITAQEAADAVLPDLEKILEYNRPEIEQWVKTYLEPLGVDMSYATQIISYERHEPREEQVSLW